MDWSQWPNCLDTYVTKSQFIGLVYLCILKQEVYRTKVANLQDLIRRYDQAKLKLRAELSLRTMLVTVRNWARACISCGSDQFYV